MVVCCKKYTEHLNKIYGQNGKLLAFNLEVRIITIRI
jgi:hypothetical protein